MPSRDTCTNRPGRDHVRGLAKAPDWRSGLLSGGAVSSDNAGPPRPAGGVCCLRMTPQLAVSSSDGAIRGRAHPTVSRLRPGTKRDPERERRERGGNISLAAVATRSGPSQQSGGHPRPERASGAMASGRACPAPRRSPSSASNRPLKTTEAATLLNVSPSTLRAWEQRFGFPQPQRSPGGNRYYTDGEVAALRAALEGGLSISSAVARRCHRLPAPRARTMRLGRCTEAASPIPLTARARRNCAWWN